MIHPALALSITHPKSNFMRRILLAFSLILILSSLSVPQQQKSSDRQIQNLEAFAKLFGYVKYFHPSDEAAWDALDWDKFAIYGADKVLNAKDDKELVTKLKELFLPIAPSIKIFDNKNPVRFNISEITPPSLNDYKEVSWQHLGLGINAKSTYKSVRLNRPEPFPSGSESGFAPFFQTIDAEKLVGKDIKLKGLMKVNAGDNKGSGHLWLRVDKAKGMGFFNNMSQAPATANEWKEYEFSGKIDADAKSISLGGFIQGKGEVMFDDINLYVKNGDAWETYDLKNTSFDDKTEGWFYHQQSDYNYIVKNENDKNYFQISSKTGERSTAMATQLFDQKLKIGDLVQKNITSNISVIVPLVLYGNSQQTYPVGNVAELTALKSAIDQFYAVNQTGESQALRLGNVVTTWNVFRHFFAYWDNASKSPDVILEQALNKSFDDKTPVDFRYTLLGMTAPLNDGHIWVNLKDDPTPMFFPGFSVDYVENKIVVDRVFEGHPTVKPGDIIEKIDGQAALDLFKEKKSFISGSDQWKNFNALYRGLLAGKNGTKVLSIKRNGVTQELNEKWDREYMAYIRDLGSNEKTSGEIKDGIYYLDISKVSKDTITAWQDDLGKAKAIICDLRGYPNGNHNIINHLLKDKEDTKWMFVPQIQYPDYENVSYNGLGWNMQPAKPHFPGKIIFIIDGRAISYAESFMGFIKDFKLATIIGQPTAGTNGNVNPFTLPGGYSVSWTGMLVKNHDGSRHHMNGIVPDIPLKRTIKGLAEGRDEFLEKALELAGK